MLERIVYCNNSTIYIHLNFPVKKTIQLEDAVIERQHHGTIFLYSWGSSNNLQDYFRRFFKFSKNNLIGGVIPN